MERGFLKLIGQMNEKLGVTEFKDILKTEDLRTDFAETEQVDSVLWNIGFPKNFCQF